MKSLLLLVLTLSNTAFATNWDDNGIMHSVISRSAVPSGQLNPLGGVTVGSDGYQAMCARNAFQPVCGIEIVGDVEPNLRQLDFINEFVNKSITYKADKEDYWQAAVKTGDCEDIALAKYNELILLGVDSNSLRIAQVEYNSITPAHSLYTDDGLAPERWVKHAVLIVRANNRDYVLDNLHDQTTTITESHYRWVAVQIPGTQDWRKF